MEIVDVLAENVRRYRKAAGLTQEKLGELSQLHRTYIGSIEQRARNVSIESVAKIAKALDVPPAVLFMSPSNNPTDIAEVASPRRKPHEVSGEAGELLPDDLERALDGYALATFTEDGIELQPLNVQSPDLTVQLLATLVLQGHTDEELVETYCRIEREVVSVLMSGQIARPEL